METGLQASLPQSRRPDGQSVRLAAPLRWSPGKMVESGDHRGSNRLLVNRRGSCPLRADLTLQGKRDGGLVGIDRVADGPIQLDRGGTG